MHSSQNNNALTGHDQSCCVVHLWLGAYDLLDSKSMQEPARAGALVKVIRIYNKIEEVGFGKASDYFNIIETASSAVNRSKLVMMLSNASSHYACA